MFKNTINQFPADISWGNCKNATTKIHYNCSMHEKLNNEDMSM